MGKQNIREMFAAQITPTARTIKVLSLPADNFLYERELEAQYPNYKFEFICLESDEEVYKRGLMSLDTIDLEGKVTYLNTTTTEYLKSVSKGTMFDVVWLDYCGHYSHKVTTDLNLLRPLLHANSVIGVTLQGRREKPSNMLALRSLAPASKRSDMTYLREVTMPKAMSDSILIPIKQILRYHDTLNNRRSSPMYLYIFGDTVEEKVSLIELSFRQTRLLSRA